MPPAEEYTDLHFTEPASKDNIDIPLVEERLDQSLPDDDTERRIESWDSTKFEYDYPFHAEVDLRSTIHSCFVKNGILGLVALVCLLIASIAPIREYGVQNFGPGFVLTPFIISAVMITFGMLMMRNAMRHAFNDAIGTIVREDIATAKAQVSNKDTFDGRTYVALRGADTLMLGMQRWPYFERYKDEGFPNRALAYHFGFAITYFVFALSLFYANGDQSSYFSAAAIGGISLVLNFWTQTAPRVKIDRVQFDGRKELLIAINSLIVEYQKLKYKKS